MVRRSTTSPPSSRRAWSRCTGRTATTRTSCTYLTVYNEPIVEPAEPENVDVEGIVRGIYRVREGDGDGPTVQLLASGVAVPWAIEAADLLREEWGVSAAVWSGGVLD
jgi:pyruvate dehydrogenase E1 component